MSVQDDERERELCRAFGLTWDQAHSRGGEDAWLRLDHKGITYRLSVEVKSTTGATVSTARDVSPEHIARWRKMIFVIGFYDTQDKRPELKRLLCLTPDDMSGWIDSIAAKVEPDFKIAQLASRHLEMEDLHKVCGDKAAYSIRDAKRLHKQQWSAEQYKGAADIKVGRKRMMSPEKMLEILRLRAIYIAERGATLNNPKIGKAYLSRFWGGKREARPDNAAEVIRNVMREFIEGNPSHPIINVIQP